MSTKHDKFENNFNMVCAITYRDLKEAVMGIYQMSGRRDAELWFRCVTGKGNGDTKLFMQHIENKLTE